MLNKMKLGTKLIGAFLVVAALCAVVGVYGAMKLRSTNAANTAGWDQSNYNLDSLANLNEAFLETRIQLNRMVALDTPARRESLIRDLDSQLKKLKEALTAYEKTAETDDRRFVEEDRRLMGQDGLRGAETLRMKGAQVIAQDEATSVVWGMPGFIVEAGLADRVLPLPEIGPEIVRRAKRTAEPSRP